MDARAGRVTGSLFSGVGGIDVAMESLGLGPVAWQCDIDPAARAVLARHWPGVRCYEDVREIDASATRVSVVCGGFSCQPHSTAGRRKGTADARWIWPEFARVIRELRPLVVFVENVPGLRTSGLRDVLADLAGAGFDAQWGLYSAAEVGAPHRRTRLFILAYARGERESGLQPRRRRGANGAAAAGPGGNGAHGDVANANREPGETRRPDHAGEGARGRDADRGRERAAVADANGEGELQQGGAVEQERRWVGDGGNEALPHPDGLRLLRRAHQQAATWTAGSDAAQGDHAGPAEPGLGFKNDGLSRHLGGWLPSWEEGTPRVLRGVEAREEKLRLLGNSCVPIQAAHAFLALSARVPGVLP